MEGQHLRSRAQLVFGQQLIANALVCCTEAQTSCIRQNKSRLIGGRAMRAPTLEQAASRQKQAKWQSHHEGIDIAGKLSCLRSKPTAVTANEGTRLRASYVIFFILLTAS
jgi:hypothetical protein